jgi:lysophospholipase L1-like esterase
MNSSAMRFLGLLSVVLWAGVAQAADRLPRRWVVSWAASAQGPYPAGSAVAQPDLKLVFPVPATGSHDQSFRLIVKPELWGCATRLRFSNAFGKTPVTFADVRAGLQRSGSAVVAETNRPVTFDGASTVTVAPGESVWSDPVALHFACGVPSLALSGRKLAISFFVPGESGPMTWHAKAMQTSYVTPPGAGSKSADADEAAFPFSTTSWYFLDALDMAAPPDAHAIVAFGDSITDGTSSTLNGDDRWPDVLARRLHAVCGNNVSVVNAGIGGNRVIGPPEYSLDAPVSGGPSALARMERDVLSLSGVSAVVWFEGINDLNSVNLATAEAVAAGMTEGVSRMRERIPGIRIIGATVVTALGSTSAGSGLPEQDVQRRLLNDFIRTSGLFDGVADFDAATLDPATGELKPEFVHNTTTGGVGDKLHPNRLGLAAMARTIDLEQLKPAHQR